MESGENKIEDSYVDVLSSDLKNHPSCPHGPTLLFSRSTKIGDRKFYACAACRDRKLCRFFQWADENFSVNRRERWEVEQKKFIGEKSHYQIYDTLCRMKPLLSQRQLCYCHRCNELIKKQDAKKHSTHDLTLNVSLHQITHPTELLKQLECDKGEAQYLFSDDAINAIINIAKENKINSVICIGAPRIHEYIKNTDLKMDSILLDLDKRYHMFYKPEDFCWFNMFNCHFFFGDDSKELFVKFLCRDQGQKFMVIVDPPFGGRLEPLAKTLQCIQTLHKQLNPHIEEDLPVILIYPYFMEQHVKSCLPKFHMTDYKVSYDNHPLFSQGKNVKKHGSPIRIFTNMNQKYVVFPQEGGYKFCELCVRWVSSENKHCKFCNQCSSKNGSTYVHCSRCQKCVKPTWKHCKKCKRCCLPTHECISFALSVKCFQCGQEGHKKQDCTHLQDSNGVPVMNIINRNSKRKGERCKTKCKKKKFRISMM